jgi:hypothetical protein
MVIYSDTLPDFFDPLSFDMKVSYIMVKQDDRFPWIIMLPASCACALWCVCVSVCPCLHVGPCLPACGSSLRCLLTSLHPSVALKKGKRAGEYDRMSARGSGTESR